MKKESQQEMSAKIHKEIAQVFSQDNFGSINFNLTKESRISYVSNKEISRMLAEYFVNLKKFLSLDFSILEEENINDLLKSKFNISYKLYKYFFEEYDKYDYQGNDARYVKVKKSIKKISPEKLIKVEKIQNTDNEKFIYLEHGLIYSYLDECTKLIDNRICFDEIKVKTLKGKGRTKNSKFYKIKNDNGDLRPIISTLVKNDEKGDIYCVDLFLSHKKIDDDKWPEIEIINEEKLIEDYNYVC